MEKKRRLFLWSTLLPLLTGVVLLFWPMQSGASGPALPAPASSGIEPSKLVFLLQYLGSDYGGAVREGHIVSRSEYGEMLDFSALLLENATRLKVSQALLGEFERLRRLIMERSAPEEVQALSRRLVPRLAAALGVVASPASRPSLEEGRQLYSSQCARCHGQNGDGHGPAAAQLDPPPRSFRDRRMNRLAPYQVFNAITFGVEGTEMPSHLESLDDRQRWDVAFFVMTLREGFAPRRPHSRLPLDLGTLAAHSNEELQASLKEGPGPVSLATLDYYRSQPPAPSMSTLLERAARLLSQSHQAYRRGDAQRAFSLAVESYLEGVEPLEPELERSARLRIEEQFGDLRSGLRGELPPAPLEARFARLERTLEEVRHASEAPQSHWFFVLLQAFTIIVREGVEAALLLALMVTYLVASGHSRLRKYLFLGALTGVLAGLLTWWVTQVAFSLSSFSGEALEGLTSLVAAAVLFSVSFWIIQQADVRHWKEYIRRKAERAMGTGSGMVLASAAFLVVYREAAETVLFYQALWMRNQTARLVVPVGFLAGVLALALLVTAMFRFGLRLPLKQFFALTGLLLGVLAFVFAGYGVRELQSIAWIKETPLSWMFQLPLLEVRPTMESCALQAGIAVSFLIGWFKLRHSSRPAVSQ